MTKFTGFITALFVTVILVSAVWAAATGVSKTVDLSPAFYPSPTKEAHAKILLGSIKVVRLDVTGDGTQAIGSSKLRADISRRLSKQGLTVLPQAPTPKGWDSILMVQAHSTGLVTVQAFRTMSKDGPLLQVWGRAILVARTSTRVFRQRTVVAIAKLVDQFGAGRKKFHLTPRKILQK